MCGIVGILGGDDRSVPTAMLDRIAHRGPDGHGVWVDTGISLGHARLAILDVAHGQQPMTDASGRYTIVYNGECYNHLELRAELEAAGTCFKTTTDTETVLEGFCKWGHEVLARMEGMFAFAIWDSHARRLFVARDPWGIKPFFHTRVEGKWAFASEIKAFFGVPGWQAVANHDRLKERASLEFLTGQGTLFAGVAQLPPGTFAWIGESDTHVRWQPYYQVASEAFASPDQAAAVIHERFVASVQEQLMADVPVGVVLSGGLDSAAVATVHQNLSEQPIHTFTVAESEEIADFQAARALSEHLGTIHHETFFGMDDVVRELPQWTWHNESINFTEFFFRPLFRRMRQDVTVGLCGQGSDELWGGYDRYRDPRRLAAERLEKIYRCQPGHAEDLTAQVAMTHQAPSALAEWDQQGQLANFQLRLVDRNSMAHGLEVRVPFLSRGLQAASRSVPWDWKLHDGTEKWILRKALQPIGLPKDLLWRRKVPAGRATGPRVMTEFEAMAAKRVDAQAMAKHPLACAFSTPAEFLVYRMWETLFIENQGNQSQTSLEDIVA